MAVADSEFADIQGLVWSGYGRLKKSCFLLLRFEDAAASRAWIGAIATSVTTAQQLRQGHVDRALHLALTADGMRTLGVHESTIAGFSPEFVGGMTGEEGRSRRLGDVGSNAPSRWRWGYAPVPHALLMLYTDSDLDSWCRQIESGFGKALTVIARLSMSDMRGEEPFGFADGISQPRIDWSNQRRPGTVADLEYGNLLSVGEFLLGHCNEYGLYTDRPVLDAALPGAAALPAAEDDPSRRDLGRNGSYLVLRELAQDVRGFWQFIAAHAKGDDAQVALAQSMVGRRMSGEPLVATQSSAIRGVGPCALDIVRNQFTYGDDAQGLQCPYGAHVRRANPRTGDMPGGRQGFFARVIRMLGFNHQDLSQDLVASSRFHRVIRRGREYGERLDWRMAARPDAPDPHAGLHFVCLNANISRQFEFIQNAWINSAKFDGMSGEADPLLGNRAPLPSDHRRTPSPCLVRTARPSGLAACRSLSRYRAAHISFCPDCALCAILRGSCLPESYRRLSLPPCTPR